MPTSPKLYHITHVANLEAIITDGGLVSDAEMIARGGPRESIGMSAIKKRRVEELGVDCHPGTRVGDYVPFYLCPRSVMLFVIHCANHPELSYKGGQGPIIHLELDLHRVIRWVETKGGRWAFSLSNAGARYTEFRCSTARLVDLDWAAIAATDFRGAEVKERKQAEFLVHGRVPFALVQRIGVASSSIRAQVGDALEGQSSRPAIEVRTDWYF